MSRKTDHAKKWRKEKLAHLETYQTLTKTIYAYNGLAKMLEDIRDGKLDIEALKKTNLDALPEPDSLEEFERKHRE